MIILREYEKHYDDVHPWPRITGSTDKGTVCEVRINNNMILRKFSLDSITANGKPSSQHDMLSEGRVRRLFLNELKWLKILDGSSWIPKTIDYDEDEQWIIQEYYGPDLLYHDWENNKPKLKEQVIQMYEFFKEHNMLKGNGSLSNMTYNPNIDQIVAFDFKWADEFHWDDKNDDVIEYGYGYRDRDKGNLMLEIRSYWKWLSKIDVELPLELLRILDDRP